MNPQQPTESPVVAPQPQPTQPPTTPALAPAPPAAPLPPVSGKKGIPLWLKIIGVLFAVIIAFVVVTVIFTNQSTKGASTVGDQLVASIQADKPEEGYQLAAPAFKQATNEDSFNGIVDRISPALQGSVSKTGKSIYKKSGQPDQAVIIYTIKTDKGTMYLRVILQDNKPWQVLNFESSPTKLELNS